MNAGQGGCPVLDINGHLIGMSVASITELDASYCLPVPALARVRDDLLFSGHIIHSWMGFEVAEQLGAEMENAVYLSTVIEDAPAGQAGLLEGDRLISIAGHPIQDVSDVPGAVFFTRANQFTSLVIKRGEEVLEFSLKTAPRPDRVPIVRQADAQDQSDTTAEPQPVEREATPPVVADPVDSSASH